MKNLIQKVDYTIGIIDPADYTNDKLYGGTTGFVKSILPFFKSQKVLIIGQGINGTQPWNNVSLSDNSTFIPIVDYKFPSKIPMRLKALFAYTLYVKKILHLGCDVLYVHSPEICLPFLFFNKKIPIIFHQHGFSNALHSSKYPYGELSIFRKFFDLAMWLIYKKAKWIIAIDQIGLKQAAANGAKNKTTLLLNAVNTSIFYPNQNSRAKLRKRLGLSNEVFSIFNAGRIEKQKGLHRIIECIPIFKSLGLPFHIFFAGEGTYVNTLIDLVKRYNAESLVTFIGRVSHENLPQYYNMADVFVLPSEKEGVPMAILESLSCGTPVVANAIGGITEFLKDGKNGMLLKNLSVKTIASAIIDVLFNNYDRDGVKDTISDLGSPNAVSTLDAIVKRVTSKA